MFSSPFSGKREIAKQPHEHNRVEKYRRYWLYYAAPEGDPYSTHNEIPSLKDFKDVPEYASGVFNYVPFVVNVDLNLLLGEDSSQMLSGPDSMATEKLHEFAEQAEFDRSLYNALFSALVCGDAYVKVVPVEDGAGVRFVSLDAASVFPRLDPHDHNRVREVLVDYRYRDEANRLRRHSELWMDDEVLVMRDGEKVEELSGDNPLGTIPIVHFACQPLPGSYFGRPSYIDVLADIDRLNSSAGAMFEVYKYYGSPKLILRGVMADNVELDPNVRQFWQLPSTDSDVSFLEWRNVTGMMDELMKLDFVVRRKLPEFILENVNDTLYPSSGYAVSLQLSLLDSKLRTLSAGFRRSAAELLELGQVVAGLDPIKAKIRLGAGREGLIQSLQTVFKLRDEGVITRSEAREKLREEGVLD
ncbi:MAG: phage portal protein [Planctomycetota bacterium]|nr:phage portal protein [Planctomycetota bacterium]